MTMTLVPHRDTDTIAPAAVTASATAAQVAPSGMASGTAAEAASASAAVTTAVTTAPVPAAPVTPSGTSQASAPVLPSPDAPPAHPRSRRRWGTLAVLCLSLLVIVVDGTIVNVALPTLARQLHASTSGLQWIVDAYTLSFAALLLLAGTLADRFGRHHALTGGLALFAVGSLAAAFTSTTTELITARAVMGVGAAFIMPATLSILTSVFTDPAERAKAIGLWTAVSGLGVAIGPTAGGWLLTHFAWDSIFLVNLPVVAVALAAGRWFVPGSRAPKPRRLDLTGAGISVTAFAALTYAFIQAPADGWTSAATLFHVSAAIALLAAFMAWEMRSSHPMLPLAIFRDLRFSGAALSIMLLFFALTGGIFLLTQIYQFVLGYSPLAAGVRTLPSAAALAIVSPLGARVARRFGTRIPVVIGLATMTAGLGLFATAAASSSYAHYVTAMVILCAGMGLAMAPATESVMRGLPPALAGIGSAVNDATRNLGSVLGVAVIGSVAASVYSSRLAGFAAAGRPAATAARQSVGAGAMIARQVGGSRGAALFHDAATAFVGGVDRGVLIAAAATLVGAVVAARTLRSQGPLVSAYAS
jgi:EmrB/QacA subfamily drug resistance transporter